MKIQGNHPKPLSQDKAAQLERGKEEVQSKGNQKASLVKATKSVSSDLTLAKVKQKIHLEPDVNVDKVNALKDRIKKGDYKIDMQKLAGNLLKDSALEDV